VLKELGRYEDALASYAQALRIAPDYFEAWNNQGVALRHLERADEAVVSFERAIALRPAVAEVHNNLGLALHALGDDEKALDAFAVSLRLDPQSAHAAMNMGVSLYELKRYDEALASLMRALEIEPDNLDVQVNLGNVLLELHRHDEALECYRKVVEARPGDQDVLMNMGNALREMHRYAEALPYYQAALDLDPACVEVHWNQALCFLAMGDFERGWEGFEWRWKSAAISNTQRRFDAPQWTGAQPLAGKTLLVHAEQGLGDTIQFCRYAKTLAAQGAKVLLRVQPPLVPLLQGLAGVERLLVPGEPPPRFDVHCPLLSLPLALGTSLQSIPEGGAYLQASGPHFAERLAAWQARLGARDKPRIGLVWSGNAHHKNDRNRSIALGTLARMVSTKARFVALQNEAREADAAVLAQRGDIAWFGAELVDFAETAALVAQLDLVISVDTSVAHLAAAMGKPVWLLLPVNPDWRWLLEREDSPWYDSMRLFRQTRRGDWSDVVERVAREIARLA
jgi:tetratricopeptide (TPR) repeat protein